jgi:hypothetical protein
MSVDDVELTINEVRHARELSTDLYVVDHIRLERLNDGTIRTSGGRIRHWPNWTPADASLSPNDVKLSRYRHQPEDDFGQGCQPRGLAWLAGLVPAARTLGLAFVAASRALRDQVAVPGDLGGEVGGELVKERRGKSIRSR